MVIIEGRTERIALLFIGYIIWIFESCERMGIKRIYFLTREGEFFKKIADVVISGKQKWKKTFLMNILEVSRMSTFASSIYEWNVSELKRIWSLYNKQSIRALCISLDIDTSIIERYLEKYGLTIDEPIIDPWKDDRMIALLQDTELSQIMKDLFEMKRAVLRQYFYQKGITSDLSEPVALVDIGWRGTIQDNIARIFPEIRFEGFYLCLAPFLNEQPLNAHKQSYLRRRDSQIILKYPTPMEMLCNSSLGSVTRYEIVGEKVEAVRENEPLENRVYNIYTRKFQETVLRSVRKASIPEADLCLHLGRRGMESFLLWPEKKASEAFFTLRHNEKFGNGRYVDKDTSINQHLYLEAVFNRKKRKRLKEDLWMTTWPQGYLRKKGKYWWLIMYNVLLRLREGISGKDKEAY